MAPRPLYTLAKRQSLVNAIDLRLRQCQIRRNRLGIELDRALEGFARVLRFSQVGAHRAQRRPPRAKFGCGLHHSTQRSFSACPVAGGDLFDGQLPTPRRSTRHADVAGEQKRTSGRARQNNRRQARVAENRAIGKIDVAGCETFVDRFQNTGQHGISVEAALHLPEIVHPEAYDILPRFARGRSLRKRLRRPLAGPLDHDRMAGRRAILESHFSMEYDEIISAHRPERQHPAAQQQQDASNWFPATQLTSQHSASNAPATMNWPVVKAGENNCGAACRGANTLSAAPRPFGARPRAPGLQDDGLRHIYRADEWKVFLLGSLPRSRQGSACQQRG
jgi:hypothetical protein